MHSRSKDRTGYNTATFQGGNPRQDMSVFLTASISQFARGANFGPILLWQATGAYYKIYLDGTSLVLVKRLPGEATSTQIAAVLRPAQANVFYSLRFQASGRTLLAKAWPTQEAEPDWQIIISDPSITTAGQGGIRAFLGPGQTVAVRAFIEE